MYTFLHFYLFVFFNDTATTEIYTLSLHDALPISSPRPGVENAPSANGRIVTANATIAKITKAGPRMLQRSDRKSTRLNSSHANISYAVFCLKKKNKNNI